MDHDIKEMMKLTDDELKVAIANISPLDRKILVTWLFDNGYTEFGSKIANIAKEIEFALLNVFQESLLHGTLNEILKYFNVVDVDYLSSIINLSEDLSLEMKEYYIMLLQDTYHNYLESIDYIEDYEEYVYWRENRCPLFSKKVIKSPLNLKM